MDRTGSYNLNSTGFQGDLEWVYNEEGSGAKYFNSSLYYPDSLTNPQSRSGVTIDPGVDLGHANKKLIFNVLNYYASRGLLSTLQISVLREAIGLKVHDAIEWFKANREMFKNSFLVPKEEALYVLDRFTAPAYFEPLVRAMPELLSISPVYLRKAIHTALLSHSYNRGQRRTIKLAEEFMIVKNYDGLAKKIKNVGHRMKSLKERRKREGELILNAIKQRDFNVSLAEVTPMPLTVINGDKLDDVIEKIKTDFNKQEVLC